METDDLSPDVALYDPSARKIYPVPPEQFSEGVFLVSGGGTQSQTHRHPHAVDFGREQQQGAFAPDVGAAEVSADQELWLSQEPSQGMSSTSNIAPGLATSGACQGHPLTLISQISPSITLNPGSAEPVFKPLSTIIEDSASCEDGVEDEVQQGDHSQHMNNMSEVPGDDQDQHPVPSVSLSPLVRDENHLNQELQDEVRDEGDHAFGTGRPGGTESPFLFARDDMEDVMTSLPNGAMQDDADGPKANDGQCQSRSRSSRMEEGDEGEITDTMKEIDAHGWEREREGIDLSRPGASMCFIYGRIDLNAIEMQMFMSTPGMAQSLADIVIVLNHDSEKVCQRSRSRPRKTFTNRASHGR